MPRSTTTTQNRLRPTRSDCATLETYLTVIRRRQRAAIYVLSATRAAPQCAAVTSHRHHHHLCCHELMSRCSNLHFLHNPPLLCMDSNRLVWIQPTTDRSGTSWPMLSWLDLMLGIFRPSIRPPVSLRPNHHLPPPGQRPPAPLVIVYHRLIPLPRQRLSRDLLAVSEGSRGGHANAVPADSSPLLASSTVQVYAVGFKGSRYNMQLLWLDLLLESAFPRLFLSMRLHSELSMGSGNLVQSSATAVTLYASSRELSALGLPTLFSTCAEYPLGFSSAHTADQKLNPMRAGSARRHTCVPSAAHYHAIANVLVASATVTHTCADF